MSTPPAASSSSDCKEPSAPQQRSHRRTRSVSPCRRGRSASPRRPRIRDQDCLEVCLSGPSPKWNRSLPVLGDTTVGALRHSVSEMMQVPVFGLWFNLLSMGGSSGYSLEEDHVPMRVLVERCRPKDNILAIRCDLREGWEDRPGHVAARDRKRQRDNEEDIPHVLNFRALSGKTVELEVSPEDLISTLKTRLAAEWPEMDPSVLKLVVYKFPTPGVGVTLRPSHFSLLHFFDAVKNRDEVAVIPNEDSKYLWLIKGHMAKPTKPERILPVELDPLLTVGDLRAFLESVGISGDGKVVLPVDTPFTEDTTLKELQLQHENAVWFL